MANPISPTADAATATATAEVEVQEENETLDPQTIEFLKTCSPRALSQQLSQHRGPHPSDTSSFLKQAYQHAEQAALQVVMSQPKKDASNADFHDDDDDDEDGGGGGGGSMLLQEPLETSLMTPRMGKVSIQLSRRGGFLATRLNMSNSSQQQHLHLPQGSVSHLIVFPKPEDCKLIKQQAGKKSNNNNKLTKVKGHVVLLKLGSPIQFQGKDLDQVCFQLPWNKNDGCVFPKLTDTAVDAEPELMDDDDDGLPAWRRAADHWRRTLTQALQTTKPSDATNNSGDDDEENETAKPIMKVSQVRVNSTVFTSHIEIGTSTTTSGMPYVSCNRGVQDGVLYPLKQGLLFFKPPRFLPLTEMQHLEFSRGRSAGQSSNRYVDFTVVLKPKQEEGEDDSKKIQAEEYSNILSQEEGPLQEYNQEYILPFLSTNDAEQDDSDEEAASGGVQVQAEAVDTEEEESDEDDDDFIEGNETDDDDEGGDETDDEDGGIRVVADEMMKELKENAHKRKDESSSSDDDTDATESETEATDENGNKIKKRKSKRLKRMSQ